MYSTVPSVILFPSFLFFRYRTPSNTGRLAQAGFLGKYSAFYSKFSNTVSEFLIFPVYDTLVVRKGNVDQDWNFLLGKGLYQEFYNASVIRFPSFLFFRYRTRTVVRNRNSGTDWVFLFGK